METLAADFSSTRAEIAELRGVLESLRTSVVNLLPHISPTAPLLPIDSLNAMIDSSFRFATVELGLGSVDALLASGELTRIPSVELKSLLAGWPADVARLRRQSGLLEENRELVLDHLHGLVSTLDIARNTGQMQRYPASSFSASPALIQRDRRLEGLFGNRGMMIEDTDEILIELGRRADRVLALLADELGTG